MRGASDEKMPIRASQIRLSKQLCLAARATFDSKPNHRSAHELRIHIMRLGDGLDRSGRVLGV